MTTRTTIVHSHTIISVYKGHTDVHTGNLTSTNYMYFYF